MSENLSSYSNWTAIIASLSVLAKFATGAAVFMAGQLFQIWRNRK